MSNAFLRWRAARLLLAAIMLVAALAWAAPAAYAQDSTPPQPAPQDKPPQQQPTPAPAQAQPAAPASAQGEAVAAQTPSDAPLYREFRGAALGMKADEARQKLGQAEEKGEDQDLFVFSESERARVYYDKDKKVSAVIATYIGKSSNAPKPEAVLGAGVEANQDGSMYKMVRYEKAGYWVAYSRTAGDEPLTIITMQKL